MKSRQPQPAVRLQSVAVRSGFGFFSVHATGLADTSASRQLTYYQRIRAECWANESLEVREEVLKIYDTKHNGDKEDDDGEENEDETDEVEDEKSLLERQQG